MNNRFYKNTKPFTTCKDHTVTDESFELLYNLDYDMLVTTPVPENLEMYYESDNYISHTDSKKSFFDNIYQFVKNITLKRKLKLINSFESFQKRILDIGAGTGDFLKVCKNDGWKILGTEPNKTARQLAEQKGVFLKETLTKLPDQKFDVITLWHVLEHITDLSDFINNLKNLLKENGTLVVAVPNFKSYDAKHYKHFWAAYDVPRHVFHFSQSAIKKIFSEVDMEVHKILPMKFDAYYVSLLSEKYKSGKLNFIKSFWFGFTSNYHAKKNSEYSSLIYILKKAN